MRDIENVKGISHSVKFGYFDIHTDEERLAKIRMQQRRAQKEALYSYRPSSNYQVNNQ